jgi:hypothetical protein
MAEGIERRAGRRLFSYWLQASGERRFPALEQVIRSVDPALWDLCFVIDVRGGPTAYRISKVGDALRARFTEDYGGRGLDSLPRSIADDVTDICYAAVSSGKPVARGEDLTHLFGQTLSYRIVLLPVGGCEDRVDALVGTLGYLKRPLYFPLGVVRSAGNTAPPPRPGT